MQLLNCDRGSSFHRRVECGQDAPHHGCQVGDKGQAHPFTGGIGQTLADLRMVAMSRHAIGSNRLRRLTQQIVFRGLAPGAAHPGLGIGDQALTIYQALLQQWQQAQLHGGRVTARHGDQAGITNRFPIHLRQSIDCHIHQLGTGMGSLVPLLPQGDVLDAKIGREIDDSHALIQQVGGGVHGNRMGRGIENKVASRECIGIGSAEFQVHVAAQVGKVTGHRLALQLP